MARGSDSDQICHVVDVAMIVDTSDLNGDSESNIDGDDDGK